MSLRLRLLLAVGAVALTALVIADVVTYEELRSFLYGRIDQSLELSHMSIERALGSGPGGPVQSPSRRRVGTSRAGRAGRARRRPRARHPRRRRPGRPPDNRRQERPPATA